MFGFAHNKQRCQVPTKTFHLRCNKFFLSHTHRAADTFLRPRPEPLFWFAWLYHGCMWHPASFLTARAVNSHYHYFQLLHASTTDGGTIKQIICHAKPGSHAHLEFKGTCEYSYIVQLPHLTTVSFLTTFMLCYGMLNYQAKFKVGDPLVYC